MLIPRIKNLPNDQELNELIRGGVMAKMKANAFGAFCYLCTKQYFNEPVTLETMAEQLGIPERAVEDAFKRLINLGYAE